MSGPRGRRYLAQHARNSEAVELFMHRGEILVPAAEMALGVGQRRRVDIGQTVIFIVHEAAAPDQRSQNRARAGLGLIWRVPGS